MKERTMNSMDLEMERKAVKKEEGERAAGTAPAHNRKNQCGTWPKKACGRGFGRDGKLDCPITARTAGGSGAIVFIKKWPCLHLQTTIRRQHFFFFFC
jgi:hypothetical protein